jgi:hypothetical protein
MVMIKRDEICCNEMAERLLDSRVADTCPLKYWPAQRTYVMLVDPTAVGAPRAADEIKFCPWCGTKLPASLMNDYINEIESLNIRNPKTGILDKRKIPRIFRTDEWWKKKER